MARVTIFSTIQEEDREKLGISKWRKRLPYRWYQSYLMKCMPIYRKEVSYYGIDCYQICLPFQESELQQYEEEFLLDFMEQCIKKEEIEFCYFEKNIAFACKNFCLDYSWVIPYLMFPKMLELVMKQNHLRLEEIRPFIIDSNDRKIEYILDYMVPHLNYLVIQTNRKKEFEPFVEAVYEQYGLVIEVLSIQQESMEKSSLIQAQIKQCNVIIDLDKSSYKQYLYLKKGSIVLDLNQSIEKETYLSSRRSDLKKYKTNDFRITIAGETIDLQLAAILFVSQVWKINQLTRNKAGLSYQEGKEVIQRNQLKITMLEQ